MPYLTHEVRLPGKDWKLIAEIQPADLPGSIVDNTDDTGSVILFSCMGPTSVIARVIGGARSMRTVTPMLREVRVPRGRAETLAQISNGQSYERDMKSAKGLTYRAKWTHHGC